MDRTVRWFAMPVSVQISNIGSEVNRALNWKKKNDRSKMLNFYNKSIELLRLTETDPKNRHRRGEFQCCEEELADFFLGENLYGTTEEMIRKYYDAFI